MARYIVYDALTNEVLRMGEAPEHLIAAQATGTDESAAAVTGAQLNEGVYDPASGNVTPHRPLPPLDRTTIPADGTPHRIATNLPGPATVVVEGSKALVTDGVLDITAYYPGVYSIYIHVSGYVPFEGTIHAT